MDLKNYLKQNIPEFQQGEPHLDSYLDAAGDFLNGTKEAIEHFDYSHDYKRGEFFNVENATRGRGIRLPVGLPDDTRKRLLRDLAEIILKNGTEDGLVHALRLVGFGAEILEGWIPDPESIRAGYYNADYVSGYEQTVTLPIGSQTPSIGRYLPDIGSLRYRENDPHVVETELIGTRSPEIGEQIPYIGSQYYQRKQEKERHDITSYSYTRLLYGSEKVYEDGVFFNGWKYSDRFKQRPITKLPIVGEIYETTPNKMLKVSKTPYNIVRFEEDNFNISVSSYVDPETGIEYSYSVDEGYRLVVQLIDYFVKNVFRPTTMRTIVIVTLQDVVEEVVVDDTLDESWTVSEETSTDNIGWGDSLDMQGCFDMYPVIGSPLLVGDLLSPFVSQFSIVSPARIGVDPVITYWNIGSYYPYIGGDMDIPIGDLGSQDPNSNTINEFVNRCEVYDPEGFTVEYGVSVNDSGWYIGKVTPVIGSTDPIIGERGDPEYSPIPIWKKTELTFNNDIDTRLVVRGSVKDVNGGHQFTPIASVDEGESYKDIIPPQYHFVHVVGEKYTNKDLNVSLSYQ